VLAIDQVKDELPVCGGSETKVRTLLPCRKGCHFGVFRSAYFHNQQITSLA
jgi:hypothetical protein